MVSVGIFGNNFFSFFVSTFLFVLVPKGLFSFLLWFFINFTFGMSSLDNVFFYSTGVSSFLIFFFFWYFCVSTQVADPYFSIFSVSFRVGKFLLDNLLLTLPQFYLRHGQKTHLSLKPSVVSKSFICRIKWSRFSSNVDQSFSIPTLCKVTFRIAVMLFFIVFTNPFSRCFPMLSCCVGHFLSYRN